MAYDEQSPIVQHAREKATTTKADDGWAVGMSLRDYFAAKALPSCLSASAANDGSYDYVAAAIGAYMVADAMLAEREK